MNDYLNKKRSSGDFGRRETLPPSLQTKMNQSFGMDFSSVKLYRNDEMAGTGMQGLAAGNRVILSKEVDLNSRLGQAILGHELSHIRAQSEGIGMGHSGYLQNADLERKADTEGLMAAHGQPIFADRSGMSMGPGMSSMGTLKPLSGGLSASAGAPMQAWKPDKKTNESAPQPQAQSVPQVPVPQPQVQSVPQVPVPQPQAQPVVPQEQEAPEEKGPKTNFGQWGYYKDHKLSAHDPDVAEGISTFMSNDEKKYPDEEKETLVQQHLNYLIAEARLKAYNDMLMKMDIDAKDFPKKSDHFKIQQTDSEKCEAAFSPEMWDSLSKEQFDHMYDTYEKTTTGSTMVRQANGWKNSMKPSLDEAIKRRSQTDNSLWEQEKREKLAAEAKKKYDEEHPPLIEFENYSQYYKFLKDRNNLKNRIENYLQYKANREIEQFGYTSDRSKIAIRNNWYRWANETDIRDLMYEVREYEKDILHEEYHDQDPDGYITKYIPPIREEQERSAWAVYNNNYLMGRLSKDAPKWDELPDKEKEIHKTDWKLLYRTFPKLKGKQTFFNYTSDKEAEIKKQDDNKSVSPNEPSVQKRSDNNPVAPKESSVQKREKPQPVKKPLVIGAKTKEEAFRDDVDALEAELEAKLASIEDKKNKK